MKHLFHKNSRTRRQTGVTCWKTISLLLQKRAHHSDRLISQAFQSHSALHSAQLVDRASAFYLRAVTWCHLGHMLLAQHCIHCMEGETTRKGLWEGAKVQIYVTASAIMAHMNHVQTDMTEVSGSANKQPRSFCWTGDPEIIRSERSETFSSHSTVITILFFNDLLNIGY